MLALCLVVLAVAPGAPEPAVGRGLDLQGAMSGVRRARQVVVRNARQWAALWREHAGRTRPAPPPPAVDFRRLDVVAVFAGQKPTGGYAVEIGAVEREKAGAVVHATLLKPARGMMTAQVITSPFALRTSPKLPKVVRFEVAEKERGPGR